MTKQDLLQYLINLHSIMEAKEATGITKGTRLLWEYNRCYEQYIEMITKEYEDETRKRDQLKRQSEARADLPRDQPEGRSSVGESRRDGSVN